MERSKSRVFKLLNNVQFVQWVNNPTDESTHFWTKWISNHPECRKDVEIAKQVIQSAQLTSDKSLPDKSYDRILENIVLYSLNTKRTRSTQNSFSFRLIGIAASIAAILGLGIFGYMYNVVETEIATVSTIHKQAPPGSRVTTKLPDGSIVTLNSGSQISFSSQFVGSTREVWLDGEAFFEVVRNTEKPFFVNTNGDVVQVLGTSFNVRSYPIDDQVKVSVASGRVSYTSRSGENVVLTEDEEAIYSTINKTLHKGNVNRAQAFGWKNKVLYFDSRPFADIVKELERWYGIKIKIDGNLEHRGPYSGEFNNAPLEEVLNGLSFVYRFDYKIMDEIVILKNTNQ
ncbi:MAG: FecR family protein [Bacteroidota bacterium]